MSATWSHVIIAFFLGFLTSSVLWLYYIYIELNKLRALFYEYFCMVKWRRGEGECSWIND